MSAWTETSVRRLRRRSSEHSAPDTFRATMSSAPRHGLRLACPGLRHAEPCLRTASVGGAPLSLHWGKAEAHEKQKQERLARAIEAALARRDPPRPAPDYVIPAVMGI